jgi:hypothetical protein
MGCLDPWTAHLLSGRRVQRLGRGHTKEKNAVLEAVADCGLFLWCALFKYTETLNDTTILSLSPSMDRLTDGTFHQVEEGA